MRFMRKVYVIRHPMHSNPIDRDSACVEVSQLFNFRLVVAYGYVTAHAETDCRNRRCGALCHVPVAEGAVQPQVLNVGGVGKRYRLFGAVVQTEGVQREPKPSRNHECRYGDNYCEPDDTAKTKRAE